jgi:hypothetical protein
MASPAPTPLEKNTKDLKAALLTELGKELKRAQARSEAAKSMDPPKEYTFHFALQNAMNSLAVSDKQIRTPSDLDGIKGFGDTVKSVAISLMHRIVQSDTTAARHKPLRHKHATPYAPKYGSQAFAVLCIMRRHDAAVVQDFAKWNLTYGYSNTPFLQGTKGWGGQPMSMLIRAGLVIGAPETGWQLTADGVDAADEALRKFDLKETNPGKRYKPASASAPSGGSSSHSHSHSQSAADADEWDEDELEVVEAKESKQLKGKQRSKRLDSFWETEESFGEFSPSSAGLGLSSSRPAAPASPAVATSSTHATPTPATPTPTPTPSSVTPTSSSPSTNQSSSA